jgi:hypothetical protein
MKIWRVCAHCNYRPLNNRADVCNRCGESSWKCEQSNRYDDLQTPFNRRGQQDQVKPCKQSSCLIIFGVIWIIFGVVFLSAIDSSTTGLAIGVIIHFLWTYIGGMCMCMPRCYAEDEKVLLLVNDYSLIE